MQSFKYNSFLRCTIYASILMELTLIVILFFFFSSTPYIDVFIIYVQFTLIPFNCLYIIYLHYANIMPYIFLSTKLILFEILIFWGIYFGSSSMLNSIERCKLGIFCNYQYISLGIKTIINYFFQICLMTVFFSVNNYIFNRYWTNRKIRFDNIFINVSQIDKTLIRKDLIKSIIIPAIIILIPLLIIAVLYIFS